MGYFLSVYFCYMEQLKSQEEEIVKEKSEEKTEPVKEKIEITEEELAELYRKEPGDFMKGQL